MRLVNLVKFVALAAVLLLTGCNGVQMSSANSEMSKASADERNDGTSRNPDGYPEGTSIGGAGGSCQSRGFTPKGPGQWVKTVKVPCDYSGIGYRVVEVTVDPTLDPSICDTYSPFLQNNDFLSLLGGLGASYPGLIVVEKEKHCAQSARCGSSMMNTTQALGRWAWIKKCENQVPAFRELLALIRDKEKTPVSNASPVPFSLFGRTVDQSLAVAKYYPVVPRKGAAVSSNTDTPDAFPAPAVKYAGQITNVDQLANSEIQSQVTDACPSAADVQPIDTLCSPGCYRADQRVLVEASGRYQGILDARTQAQRSIAVLTQTSSLQNPQLTNAPVGRFVASLNDEKEILLHIETNSGIKLVVTGNHPLLDARGVMREASDLKIGDQLLRVDGRADTIARIHNENFIGKVYNVAPVSALPEDNLIVAEGVISGSHNYQTELHSYINRHVLRSHLSKGY